MVAVAGDGADARSVRKADPTVHQGGGGGGGDKHISVFYTQCNSALKRHSEYFSLTSLAVRQNILKGLVPLTNGNTDSTRTWNSSIKRESH